MFLSLLLFFQSHLLLTPTKGDSQSYDGLVGLLESKGFQVDVFGSEAFIKCKYKENIKKYIKVGNILFRLAVITKTDAQKYHSPIGFSHSQCVKDYDKNCVFQNNDFVFKSYGENFNVNLKIFGLAKSDTKELLFPDGFMPGSVFQFKGESDLFFKSIYCTCNDKFMCSLSKTGTFIGRQSDFKPVSKNGKVTFGEDMLVSHRDKEWNFNFEGDKIFVMKEKIDEIEIKCKEGRLFYNLENAYEEVIGGRIRNDILLTEIPLEGDEKYYEADLICFKDQVSERFFEFCDLTSDVFMNFCGVKINEKKIKIGQVWELSTSQNSKCRLECKKNLFGVFFVRNYLECPLRTPTLKIKESPNSDQNLLIGCKRKHSAFKKQNLRFGSKVNSIEVLKKETCTRLDLEYFECSKFCRLEKVIKDEKRPVFHTYHEVEADNENGFDYSGKLLFDGERSEISCGGDLNSKSRFSAVCEEGTVNFYSGRGFRRKSSSVSDVCKEI